MLKDEEDKNYINASPLQILYHLQKKMKNESSSRYE
jgi:hypothetical protein